MGKRILIGMLVGLSLLAGCGREGTSETSDPKLRWIAGEPCEAPCWENIEPGITTQTDALEFLKVSPSIDSDSITVEETPEFSTGVINWRFASQSTTWSGKILYRLNEPTVFAISLTGSDLCLGDVIAAYGDPDYLLLPPYVIGGILDLIWNSRGLVFETQLASASQSITEEVCNGTVIHHPPNTPLEGIPSLMFQFASEEDLVPWNGYGNQYGQQ